MLLLLLASGCGLTEAAPDALALDLGSLPRERVKTPQEERDAWRGPGGSLCKVELGQWPDTGGALRLGLLPAEGTKEGVKVGIYIAGDLVDEFETTTDHAWVDRRLDLAGQGGGACEVVFDAKEEFWISTCELVQGEPTQTNVLVFLIDALRADHLGCYGYDRDTSPTIDLFAKESVRFTHVTAQASWTRPSVASLLTSTYPNLHGAEDRPDVMRGNLPALATALGAAGYETQCFMTNPNCLPIWGTGRGFSRFVDADSMKWLEADDAKAVNRVMDALENVAGRPWFFYVHVMGPHEPYIPKPSFDTKFTPRAPTATQDEKVMRDMALYDGKIAYADAQFGRLLADLKARGLYDKTLIVLLSDHGEQFMEHGDTSHGKSLYQEEIHVPLMVRMPGGRARRGGS